MVVEVTSKTAVKVDIPVPIKSPTYTYGRGSAETVITPVVSSKDVAVILNGDAIAPTHCATRLTNALAD